MIWDFGTESLSVAIRVVHLGQVGLPEASSLADWKTAAFGGLCVYKHRVAKEVRMKVLVLDHCENFYIEDSSEALLSAADGASSLLPVVIPLEFVLATAQQGARANDLRRHVSCYCTIYRNEAAESKS